MSDWDTANRLVRQALDAEEDLRRVTDLQREATERRRAAARGLLDLGWSLSQVAAALGISKSRADQITRQAKTPADTACTSSTSSVSITAGSDGSETPEALAAAAGRRTP